MTCSFYLRACAISLVMLCITFSLPAQNWEVSAGVNYGATLLVVEGQVWNPPSGIDQGASWPADEGYFGGQIRLDLPVFSSQTHQGRVGLQVHTVNRRLAFDVGELVFPDPLNPLNGTTRPVTASSEGQTEYRLRSHHLYLGIPLTYRKSTSETQTGIFWEASLIPGVYLRSHEYQPYSINYAERDSIGLLPTENTRRWYKELLRPALALSVQAGLGYAWNWQDKYLFSLKALLHAQMLSARGYWIGGSVQAGIGTYLQP